MTRCDNWPFPDEPGIDGWYGYGCVDMLGCLSQLHSTNNNGQTTQYTVTEVKFSKPTSGDFYIDNLAFAKSIVNGKLHLLFCWHDFFKLLTMLSSRFFHYS